MSAPNLIPFYFVILIGVFLLYLLVKEEIIPMLKEHEKEKGEKG